MTENDQKEIMRCKFTKEPRENWGKKWNELLVNITKKTVMFSGNFSFKFSFKKFSVTENFYKHFVLL